MACKIESERGRKPSDIMFRRLHWYKMKLKDIICSFAQMEVIDPGVRLIAKEKIDAVLASQKPKP